MERWGQERIESEVMPDHVHLLVGCDPQFGMHRLVKLLNGHTSPALRAEFPALKRRLPSLWTNQLLLCQHHGRCDPGNAETRRGKPEGTLSGWTNGRRARAIQYKLTPTPEQAGMLDRTLMLCRHVYNAAIGERREAWRLCGASVNYYQQKAELPGIKEAMPEYAEVHSQVLQDVVLRVDRAFQAFFRRAKAGETAGYPRFHGRNRYHSFTSPFTSPFTYPQYDNGARLDNGFLVLSKIGRVAVRWSRPLEGTPKTVTLSQEADGWYAISSCTDVPAQPLPATGRETGIDVGLQVFLSTADGAW